MLSNKVNASYKKFEQMYKAVGLNRSAQSSFLEMKTVKDPRTLQISLLENTKDNQRNILLSLKIDQNSKEE
jgi:hypothetical protein